MNKPNKLDKRHIKSAGMSSFPLEYPALGLLYAQPCHGYGLYREFVTQFHLVWKAGQANFYMALANLEASGFVTIRPDPNVGYPPRKVYHITPDGRTAFLEWLNAPVPSMRAFRVEFIARLRFFALLNLPGAEQLIAQEVAIFRRLLDEWQQPDSTGDPVTALVDDYRRRQAHMIIDWLLAWQERFAADMTAR